MNPLTPWRTELRSLISHGFLRRDQGEGLFVSDYPRFGETETTAERIKAAGFSVDISDGLAHIDGSPDIYRTLLDAVPPEAPEPTDDTLFLFALARRLERSGAPFDAAHVPVLRETLKAMDAGDTGALYRFLSPAAALAQRKHTPLPAGLGRMVLHYLSGTGQR